MSTTMDRTATAVTQTQSRDWLRIISVVLLVIGIFISGYLSWSHLTEVPTICTQGAGFNCEVVQSSIYSKLAGIPIAYLGFLVDVVLLALVLLENRIEVLRDYGTTLFFGLVLFSFLFSAWLVYIQAVRLEAFCIWCLSHELIVTLLFIVSGLRLRKSMTAAS